MRFHWQNKRNHVSHADDWLLTYSDMITLLLCFFAIIFAFSMPIKKIQQATPRQEVAQEDVELADDQQKPARKAGKAPDVLEGNLPFHGLERAEARMDKSAEEKPVQPADPQPETAKLSEGVEQLKQQSAATVEEKGDRITTIEMSSAAFFDVGSSTLNDAGKPILLDVAATVKSDAYKDYQVTVEGHTDDSPIKTPMFPSNWELSTARASAVVQFFLQQGITAQRLRAAGYADTFPKVPNRDAAGNPLPKNQAKNRRVVIKLEKIDKSR